MSGIAAGVWEGLNGPSSDLCYIHILYSSMLQYLYLWRPEIPWYGTLFIIHIAVSLLVINYSVLRLQRDTGLSFLVFIASLGTVVPALWHLQHTIIAGLSSMGGGLLLISFYVRTPRSNLGYVTGVAVVLFLLLMGAMIRFSSFLMIATLFTPFGLILALKTIFSATVDNLAWKNLYRSFLTLCLSGLFVLGLQYWNTKVQEERPDWSYWHDLEEAKAEFIDFNHIEYSQETEDMFASVGWDSIDYYMIKTWQYVDRERYSLKNFNDLIDSVSYQPLFGKPARIDSNYLRHRIEHLIRSNLYVAFAASLIPVTILWTFLIWRWTSSQLIYLGGTLIAIISIMLYLFFGLNRAPFRVLVLIWVGFLWLMILLATNFDQQSIWLSSIIYRNWIASIILICIVIGTTLNDLQGAKSIAERGRLAQEELKSTVLQWQKNLPVNSVIYNIGSSLPLEHHLPFSSFQYLQQLRGIISTGWINQSPIQGRILNAYGLASGDFFLSLTQKEDLFIVNREKSSRSNFEQEILRQFYMEKYCLGLSFIEQPSLPYLSRMVFHEQ
ncbi:MAG: hypothetical protein F6K19_20205 [Cyanothece sp. SIO1E1]|nr:hypothetical protein [Cyanothece sp. SIO1E1]